MKYVPYNPETYPEMPAEHMPEQTNQTRLDDIDVLLDYAGVLADQFEPDIDGVVRIVLRRDFRGVPYITEDRDTDAFADFEVGDTLSVVTIAENEDDVRSLDVSKPISYNPMYLNKHRTDSFDDGYSFLREDITENTTRIIDNEDDIIVVDSKQSGTGLYSANSLINAPQQIFDGTLAALDQIALAIKIEANGGGQEIPTLVGSSVLTLPFIPKRISYSTQHPSTDDRQPYRNEALHN